MKHLRTLKPDEATVTQFPAVAARVWMRRHAEQATMVEDLSRKLAQRKRVKSALLEAKLLGEVNQPDYVQKNCELDSEIANITQKLDAAHSQRLTVDAFVRFSKLMVVDIAAAWQLAPIEQRLRVQNFLFPDGIAYKKLENFLNTNNPTLFQQLRELADCKPKLGVPDGI